jgi:hypothetical protein
MGRKSEKEMLRELAVAALNVIIKTAPEGISVPFVVINVECGRLDRITEHFNKFLIERGG